MADENIAFEIYKMEYEKAAERYNNIYQQVWNNFNYLALVTGGILAFSNNSKLLSVGATVILACIPLLYWYVAVFMPGNKYGDGVIKSLARVEDILSKMYADKLNPSSIGPPRSPLLTDWGLNHFTQFHQRRRVSWWNLITRFTSRIESAFGGVRLFPPSVRATTLVAVLLLLAAANWGWKHRDDPWGGNKGSVTVEQSQKQLEVRVTNADIEEIKSLLQNSTQTRQDLERLESNLKTISEQLNAVNQRQQQQNPSR